MATKTADEIGADTGAETGSDTDTDTEAVVEVLGDADEYEGEDPENLDDAELTLAKEGPSGVGQGAAAVVSAVLGFVSLSGSWLGTVAGARQEINGQLEMQALSSASIATQLKAMYGDAWQATALWSGIFALAALLVGVAALARPAFGAPGRPQPVWIKSVSWAGVALGVLGLLLAVLKYTDVILGVPTGT